MYNDDAALNLKWMIAPNYIFKMFADKYSVPCSDICSMLCTLYTH